MMSEVVFEAIHSVITHDSDDSGCTYLTAFVSEPCAESTSTGVKPTAETADVSASTWSVLAATIITDLSPFSVSPMTCRSQIISSIGKGIPCSIS